MVEVVTVRELRCRLCGYIKVLAKDEPEPGTCPACNDGRTVSWQIKSEPDTWTA